MVARKEGLQAQIPVPRVAELDLKRIGTVRVVFLRFKNDKQLAILHSYQGRFESGC